MYLPLAGLVVATERGIVLPFTDIESLKTLIIESIQETVIYLGGYAGVATKQFLLVVVGAVVAISIFINPTLDFDQSPRTLNLYSLHCARVAELFEVRKPKEHVFRICIERLTHAPKNRPMRTGAKIVVGKPLLDRKVFSRRRFWVVCNTAPPGRTGT